MSLGGPPRWRTRRAPAARVLCPRGGRAGCSARSRHGSRGRSPAPVPAPTAGARSESGPAPAWSATGVCHTVRRPIRSRPVRGRSAAHCCWSPEPWPGPSRRPATRRYDGPVSTCGPRPSGRPRDANTDDRSVRYRRRLPFSPGPAGRRTTRGPWTSYPSPPSHRLGARRARLPAPRHGGHPLTRSVERFCPQCPLFRTPATLARHGRPCPADGPDTTEEKNP